MLCTSCTRDLEADARFCGLCGSAAQPLDGRYRLEERIAAGGFGTIYRATCVTSGDALAIKVLHGDLARSEALARRFRREGATLANLRHPHTLRTFEAGETDDGTLYIAMELLDGESLRQRLDARGPLPWREVAALLRATCLALAEAHRRGIVHRDLTPSNIFLAKLPRADFVKVLDFGVAGIIHGSARDFGERLTRYGEVIGTLAYLSPEQSVGQACDPRSDLYSLGVVAYEMITGVRPFQHATTPLALITALHTEDPAPPSTLRAGVPPELDAVLLACLARDPADRPPSAEALVDMLEELAPGLARGSSAEIAVPAAGTPQQGTVLGFGASPSRLAAALLASPRSGEVRSLGETSPRLGAGASLGETSPRLGPCASLGEMSPRLGAGASLGETSPRLGAGASLGETSPRLGAGASLGETSPRLASLGETSPRIAAGNSLTGETAPRLPASRFCAHCIANGTPDSLPGITAPRPATTPAAETRAPDSHSGPRTATPAETSSSSRHLPAHGAFRSHSTSPHAIALDEAALDSALRRSLDGIAIHGSTAPTPPADDGSAAHRASSSELLLAREVTPPTRLPFLVKLVLCVVVLSLGGFALGGGLAYVAG